MAVLAMEAMVKVTVREQVPVQGLVAMAVLAIAVREAMVKADMVTETVTGMAVTGMAPAKGMVRAMAMGAARMGMDMARLAGMDMETA